MSIFLKKLKISMSIYAFSLLSKVSIRVMNIYIKYKVK